MTQRPDCFVSFRPAAALTALAIAAATLVTPTLAALQADQDAQPTRDPGASLRAYDIGRAQSRILNLMPGQTPNVARLIPVIDLDIRRNDFGALQTYFYAEVSGFITIERAGTYHFRLGSDDGSIFYLDGDELINHDGLHGYTTRQAEIELAAGDYPFLIKFFQDSVDARLTLEWRPPGQQNFTIVPTEALSTPAGEVRVTSPGRKRLLAPLPKGAPGDRRPLDAGHPSYDLAQARPSTFEPRVGGMDWLSDGRLVICTWDADGAVYILDGVAGDDPEAITVSRFAIGLAEPLGLTVVDDEIYVLQKQELTHLVDTNGDGVADEYRAVCSGWGVTPNFHEFAFGLVYHEGYFYANLAVAINPGGATTQPQDADRGTVLKISKDEGTYELVAQGLRTPNGIGFGVDNEIFITDNQGDWLPVSKLLHLKPNSFFGSRAVDPEGTRDLEEQPPVVWLPQNEIGNSPGEPSIINDGPYRGQMIHGEVTHGGVKRVFVEKINGDYQGAVFRFIQGLEAGINRLTWGPDGSLYVGGIGSTGNWGHEGKNWFGLQRLSYNGSTTFEMLAVRAKTNGMEIEFTEPLADSVGWTREDYVVEQWRYVPTAEYGGDKIDQERLDVTSASVSPDRTRVFLELDGLKPGHVVYIRLAGPFASQSGQAPWSTEAWYTLNNIPANDRGTVRQALPPAPQNVLSAEQRAAGWRLLFDGETTTGWRGFRRQGMPDGWQVVDGALTRVGGGGDIITTAQFDNFELAFEWAVEPGGNSGVFFHVSEDHQYVWQTGPEFQILDNERHADGQNPMTSAASNYALHAPPFDVTYEPGRYNRSRLIVRGDHVEHWLNGYKVVEYELGSDNWTRRVAESKFASMPHYGSLRRGHIALQDHGDRVMFRNIMIRELNAD